MNDDERAALLSGARNAILSTLSDLLPEGVTAKVDIKISLPGKADEIFISFPESPTPVVGPAGKLLGFAQPIGSARPKRTVEISPINSFTESCVTERLRPDNVGSATELVRVLVATELTDDEIATVASAWCRRTKEAMSRAGLAAAIRDVLPDVEVKP